MDAHGPDLAGVVEADELPCLPTVGGLVHAAARGDITAHVIGSSAEINYIRIRVGDRDAAGRAQRDLAIRDRNPTRAAVSRAEQSAARDAHVESLWLRRHARYSRHASAARWSNESVTKSLEERRVYVGHQWLAGSRRLRESNCGESQGRKKGVSKHVVSSRRACQD